MSRHPIFVNVYLPTRTTFERSVFDTYVPFRLELASPEWITVFFFIVLSFRRKPSWIQSKFHGKAHPSTFPLEFFVRARLGRVECGALTFKIGPFRVYRVRSRSAFKLHTFGAARPTNTYLLCYNIDPLADFAHTYTHTQRRCIIPRTSVLCSFWTSETALWVGILSGSIKAGELHLALGSEYLFGKLWLGVWKSIREIVRIGF